MSSARAAALHVLLECRRHDAFVQELLDQYLSRSSLSPADRALTTQLVYGVLRRRGTLDALVQPCCNRPRDRVEAAVWEILRLGAFQLALLTQIPPHAALYETVNLAEPRARPFVNGVLRAVSRLLTPERTDHAAADALPLPEGGYRRLTKPVLPDPAGQPLNYLAAAFALPRWLAVGWLERYGWTECVRLGFWFAGQAALWLRCNTLKCDRAQLLSAFAEAGVRDQEAYTLTGLVVPAGTPREIIDRLHREIVRVGTSPDVKEKLATLGFNSVLNTPDEFGVRIKAEMIKWGKVVRDAKLKIE